MAATEPETPPIISDDRAAGRRAARRATDPWRRRATILARAGRLLAAPLEGEPNLQGIARLVVPHLADWCAIDLTDDRHTPQTVALAHINPQRRESLRERWQQYQAAIRFPAGYAGVARSRRLLALRHLGDRPHRATGANLAYIRALTDLRAHSALVVPLVARGPLLGIITLALVRPRREFAPDDLAVARQLAQLCALAIENARLVRAAQDEREVRRDAEHFLQATFDALGAQIAVLDGTGTITHANAAWHRFAIANNYAGRDHGLGRNYLDLCDTASGPGAEGAAEMAAGIRDVLQHRRDEFSLVYPCHTPSRQRWFIGRVTRLGGAQSDGAIIAHEDVTEQYQAEAAVRASETRFRTIFLQATDAILIADDEGRYLQANPAACALYGVADEASFLQHRVGDFSPPALREDGRASWRQFVAEGRQSGTLVLLRPDGTARTVEYRSTANLQPGRHLSILRDVTERELADAESADMQRQLTAARETERLHLARELHDTAVQQLLGISFQLAAHPQTTATADQAAEPATTLADIRRAVLATVDRLRGVIRELRPPGLEEFGLSAALDGYLSAMRRERGATLPAIDIDLDHVGDDVPHDVALCLFRVAQEALQNAIRHAEAHRVTFTLFRDDHVVTLRVADDGRGFQLPERLTAYTQLGHFGLAGMVERVKLSDGHLTITSTPGMGTTVTALIPLSREGGEGGEDGEAR